MKARASFMVKLGITVWHRYLKIHNSKEKL